MNLPFFFVDKFFAYLLKEDWKVSERLQEDQKRPLLPPWSCDSDIFTSLCTGCGACVSACTNKIITLGKDGLPSVDFSNGFCSFCGDCAQACPSGALHFSEDTQPWDLAISINENCLLAQRVLCRTCAEECDQEAIVFSLTVHEGKLPKILPEKCNGCGACSTRCPTGAVSFQKTQQIDEQQDDPVS